MSIGTKPSVSNLRILSWQRVLQKGTGHVGTKALNMFHQPQKGFYGVFLVISQYKKGYLIYVPSTLKIVPSHEFVSDKNFSSSLAYTSRPYSEALDMRPSVLYITYAT